MQNLGLKTSQFRVKDEEQRLRGWRLDKNALVRIRQSLYLDDLVSIVSSGTSPGAPHPLDAYQNNQRERPVHTLVDETNETNETNIPEEAPK